jgi:hypothetical protein
MLGGCDRANLLKKIGVEGGELSDETARYFWLGKIVHEGIQRGLSAGLRARLGADNFLHEVPSRGTIVGTYRGVELTATISGRIDTLRLLPSEVIELKTVRSKAFDYPLPQPAHVLQVSCYLAHHPYGVPAPEVARILYVAKDGDKVSEYVVKKDQRLIDQVNDTLLRQQFNHLHYLQTGELPPPLAKVPLKVKGKIVRYVKSGAWGKAGDVKLTPDHRVLYCDYRETGVCCGKKQVGQIGIPQAQSGQGSPDSQPEGGEVGGDSQAEGE